MKTPDEIKKGLECCSPKYESQHWVTCNSECPFRNEGAYCRNVLHACIKRYIQQLECERDEARNDLDALNYANTELHSAYEAMKRERDTAVDRCMTADDVSAGYYHEIQQLKAAQPKWISVEVRLPEDGQRVVAIAKNGMTGIMDYKADGTPFAARIFGRCFSEIIWWMPLPEPPKEGI